MLARVNFIEARALALLMPDTAGTHAEATLVVDGRIQDWREWFSRPNWFLTMVAQDGDDALIRKTLGFACCQRAM
jgi:hypothetical protein